MTATVYDLEAVLGSRAPGDKTNLGGYVQALADAGLAVVFVEPNGKKPLDLRTTAETRLDDTEAQEIAKAAGNADWMRAKSQGGSHLATTDAARLGKYVDNGEKRYGVDAVNLGVEVGRSNILAVDADNAADVEAFQAAWALADPTVPAAQPTVSTPGVIDAAGQWQHKGGAHFWFIVPEGVTLPSNGSYSTDGWTAYWNNRFVLVPPSVRAEGAYEWHPGNVRELPVWLLERITEQSERRETKAANRSGDTSNLDTWAASVTWADLLTAEGWTPNSKTETCGCPTWTRPGASDPKSAVAHDVGCSDERYDTDTDKQGPLHVWSDTAAAELGASTLSKVQFVAATRHGGDIGAAAKALGIPVSDNGDASAASMLFGTDTSTDPHDKALMAEVFGHSPVTEHILEQARIRLVGPWAALFLSLTHAALLTPWWVRLPAVIGNTGASLNSITALVGGSGAGKGVGSDGGILDWQRDPLDDDGLVEAGQTVDSALTAITVGSGQAFATLFREWIKVPQPKDPVTGKTPAAIPVHKLVRRAAWIDFAEVDSASSMMKSESLHFSSELRRLWDGKGLGVHTKEQDRRSELAAFTYRAVVTLGVQPERAGEMLAGEGGGLPQRLVWADTADLGRTVGGHRGERVTLVVPPPSWNRGDNEVVFMGVDPSVVEQIVTDRENVLVRSKDALTGLAAHRNLVRLKLAGAVAVLHSRADVTAEDWHLAGLLLAHSDRVRAGVQRVLAEAARTGHEARGAADAHRDEGARKTRDKSVEAAAAAIHSWLAGAKRKGKLFTGAQVRDACKTGSTRHAFCADALAVLVDEGTVRHGAPSRTGTATFEWNADRAVES
ncbi:bifunctional DNA primase/polymerase [Rhodococcus sp. H29-C3]|uniref:bifunctional DNA primase/polymerase n=1 Tax=Rhodococcus sp. H29-C3 TaxID=3046307 RepID=UPI0024BABCF1|nr:bifunctional DNA primase/polymerase [Rhodococcus sp. H29-C3]MDJ0361540.1 bifunctional DNA primase/polymerase [Rhodococcus sp. H29-C3]